MYFILRYWNQIKTKVSKGILLPCVVQRNRFGGVIYDDYK